MNPYISLYDLMHGIRQALDAGFSGHTFRILAETTDIKIYHNRQYAFFNLVEKQGDEIVAAAGGVIWKNNFHLIRDFEKATGVQFNQNLELVMEVEMQFHERYGLRLSVIDIDTAYTLGKIEQERELVLRRLATNEPRWLWLEDGEYVSANQLLKKPLVMQRIALIAAPGSDGRRDFLQELQGNTWKLAYAVTEFPASVQGAHAAAEISSGLEQIAHRQHEFDAVALVRGGGGNTDFSAFDHYDVAKSIASCPRPVFTGIGHDRNISVADVVAHESLKTPTRCAAAITENNLGFMGFVENAGQLIASSARRFIDQGRREMEDKKRRLLNAAGWRLEAEKNRLLQTDRHLEMLYPVRTLAAGYAMVRKNGKVLRSVADMQAGDRVQIRLADGTREAIITEES